MSLSVLPLLVVINLFFSSCHVFSAYGPTLCFVVTVDCTCV